MGAAVGADRAGGSFYERFVFSREPEKPLAHLVVSHLTGQAPIMGSPCSRLVRCHAL
jgi:hypothetical protein